MSSCSTEVRYGRLEDMSRVVFYSKRAETAIFTDGQSTLTSRRVQKKKGTERSTAKSRMRGKSQRRGGERKRNYPDCISRMQRRLTGITVAAFLTFLALSSLSDRLAIKPPHFDAWICKRGGKKRGETSHVPPFPFFLPFPSSSRRLFARAAWPLFPPSLLPLPPFPLFPQPTLPWRVPCRSHSRETKIPDPDRKRKRSFVFLSFFSTRNSWQGIVEPGTRALGALGTRRSALGARHSALGARHSASGSSRDARGFFDARVSDSLWHSRL